MTPAPRPALGASAAAPGNAASAPAGKTPPRGKAPQKKPDQVLQKVEVKGQASDESVRRASTASKIVVSRDEIDLLGDISLGEVLKRLPGVTTGGRPGRGGDIRMRGMGNGYTQILVNGERMPASFSLDDLPPEQVERIEILRAPTAEYGARAIAGTINIVLREAYAKRINDLRLGLNSERNHVNPNLSWTRNDKLDERGSAYTLTVNALRNRRYDDIDTTVRTQDSSQGLDSTVTTVGWTESIRESLNVNGKLQWKLANGDSLSLQPFLVFNHSTSRSSIDQDPPVGFDEAQTQGHASNSMLRLNTQWMHKLSEETRLELRGGLGRAHSDTESLRLESLEGVPSRTQQDTYHTTDTSWNFVSKLSHKLSGGEHSLVGGVEAEGLFRDQDHVSLQDGLPNPALLDFGDDLDASTLRVAAYAQDEWSLGTHWSFYAGLRWEGIRTESSAQNYSVDNSSSVWTPLLHAVWKPEENSRNQVRMSLTRSYRSPPLQSLIGLPSVNSHYPCPDQGLCGPNAVQYPDQTGNPNLRPELATGVELAIERYLVKGGLLSANVFYRDIKDLIRTETTLQTVPYASVQRWVAEPMNIGNAKTMGIELEAKFRADEFFDEALPVTVRSNVSFFHSAVDGIPGPNNRLDQQPRGTANIGLDYRLRSLPLALSGNLNYTPAMLIQESVMQANSSSEKVVLDLSAQWFFNTNTKLRLSASNATPLNYNTGSVIANGPQTITTENYGRTFTLWQLRLETKL